MILFYPIIKSCLGHARSANVTSLANMFVLQTASIALQIGNVDPKDKRFTMIDAFTNVLLLHAAAGTTADAATATAITSATLTATVIATYDDLNVKENDNIYTTSYSQYQPLA